MEGWRKETKSSAFDVPKESKTKLVQRMPLSAYSTIQRALWIDTLVW